MDDVEPPSRPQKCGCHPERRADLRPRARWIDAYAIHGYAIALVVFRQRWIGGRREHREARAVAKARNNLAARQASTAQFGVIRADDHQYSRRASGGHSLTMRAGKEPSR